MRENIFILADDYSDSANRLARYLQCEVGSVLTHHVDCLIRYGVSTAQPYSNRHTINTPQSIQDTSNKYRALQIMERNGVRVPRFSRNSDNFEPPFISQTVHHSQGRGLQIIDRYISATRNTGDGYFMKMIDVDKEYRALIWQGKCIGIDRKKEGESITSDYIRNMRNGWNFVSLSCERNPVTYRKMGRLGVKAVECLGLDFGAVDILKGENGRLYVLEVNTAMGLRVGKAKRLARCIIEDIL